MDSEDAEGQGATHLVAIGFWRGNVVLHGPGDGCPHRVDEAHNVVAQLRARSVQAWILAFAHLHNDAQLSYVLQVLDVCALLLQLPARDSLASALGSPTAATSRSTRNDPDQHILYTVVKRE